MGLATFFHLLLHKTKLELLPLRLLQDQVSCLPVPRVVPSPTPLDNTITLGRVSLNTSTGNQRKGLSLQPLKGLASD